MGQNSPPVVVVVLLVAPVVERVFLSPDELCPLPRSEVSLLRLRLSLYVVQDGCGRVDDPLHRVVRPHLVLLVPVFPCSYFDTLALWYSLSPRGNMVILQLELSLGHLGYRYGNSNYINTLKPIIINLFT